MISICSHSVSPLSCQCEVTVMPQLELSVRSLWYHRCVVNVMSIWCYTFSSQWPHTMRSLWYHNLSSLWGPFEVSVISQIWSQSDANLMLHWPHTMRSLWCSCEVTVMPQHELSVRSMWGLCDITDVESTWCQFDVTLLGHSDLTPWDLCDATAWVLCEVHLRSLWYHRCGVNVMSI